MKPQLTLSTTTIAIAMLLVQAPVVIQAAEANSADEEIEEIIVIGSRFKRDRSSSATTSPIDVLTAETLGQIGNGADITDSLRALAPSYNAAMASGDGDTFVRPTSLRGLAPDQTLVMVNGKRRHRAALIAEFVPAAGKGSHGPNIGMIPMIAIENVEVLRDGATAQYGSDAIAGVVNLRMKDSASGGELRVSHGRFFEDELSLNVAVNAGFPLGEGFANLSFEFVENEALSRGEQRPNAQGLINAGVQRVGEDSPFEDAPFVHTWGRPQTEDIRLFLNAGIPLSDSAQAYLQSNYAVTSGRYRFFYRAGDNPLTQANEAHSTIRALGIETALPQGFTPFFDGDHDDVSLVGGVKGLFGNGVTWDVSLGYGRDQLDFFLNNTVNPDLGLGISGLPRQRDFDVGALKQSEINLNADFTRGLTDKSDLAFGAEWRQETFTVIAGEPNSWEGLGSSGFKGFEPGNAGGFSRSNVAVYGEVEYELSDRSLTQWALRYEDFSDFGGTLNGKFAMRFDASDSLSLRGSVSTGFHAPTPGQSNLQKVTTTFDNDTGLQVESGTVPPSHPSAIAAGGSPLREEKAINYSMGFTSDNEIIALTTDFYVIMIDGRIYKTQNLPFIDSATGIASNVQFFTNAMDIKATGVDLVASRTFDWPNGVTTDLSFAWNHNKIDMTGQSLVNGILPVSMAEVEDIEESYPNDRFTLSTTTAFSDRLDLLARINYYGEHYDERGRIDGVDGNAPTKLLGSTVFVDLELGFDINETFRVVLGVANLFDEYPDRIGAPYANRMSVGLPYPRRTAANFEGGSWYFRTSCHW